LFEHARAEIEEKKVLANPKRDFIRSFTLHWLFMDLRRLELLGERWAGRMRELVLQRRLAGEAARTAVLERQLRNGVVIGFVGLAKVGRIRVWDGAFGAHPVQRGAGIKPTGKRDADLLACWNMLKNRRHVEKCYFRLQSSDVRFPVPEALSP